MPLVSPERVGFTDFNPPLRISILASGAGTNFEAIVQAIKSNKLRADIRCIVVNVPDCGAIKRAKAHNIKYYIHDHRNFISREALDDELIKTFLGVNTELIVMAGWMRIVTTKLIDKFPNRIINIHPSLLPSFKGKDAIQQAIDARVKITGTSVHMVSKAIDSGLLIAQAAISVTKSDTYESLSQRIKSEEHKLLPQAISLIGEKIRSV